MPDFDTPDFDPGAYAKQAAAAIGLPLNPAHLPGITMNLALAKRMAGLIEQMKLSAADEAAPVYVPRKTP
jgi:hypothetical protein